MTIGEERFADFFAKTPSATTPLVGTEPILVLQNGLTKQIASGSVGVTGIKPGTTPIIGGTDTCILFDKAGVVGEDTNLEWDDTNTALKVTGGSNAAKLDFTGMSQGGTSSGTGIVQLLGYNVTNNKQFWFGDFDYIGSSNSAFIRMTFQNGIVATIDAAAGDNSVYKNLFIGGPSTVTVMNGPLGFGGNFDLILARESANTLAIGNLLSPSNPEAVHIYNTSIATLPPTSAEWATIDWTTTPNVFTIGTQANGLGSSRNLQFVVGNTNVLDFGITGTNTWSATVAAQTVFQFICTTANSPLQLTFRNNATAIFGIEGPGGGSLMTGTTGNALVFNMQSAADLMFGASNTLHFTVSANGNIVCNSAAIATNATDGFLYIQTCAGTPTGTPTSYTGRVALVYDTTNHQFWIYDGGGWKQPKTPAAAAIVTWQ